MKWVLLPLAVLVTSAGSFTRFTSKVCWTALYTANSPDIPPALADKIKNYLSKRPDTGYSGKVVSLDEQVALQKEVAAPENDIVPELKQTGWFRDPREEDEKSRFDKTTPLVSHPLSFRELEKYGCGDLVKPILDLGGPYVVGSAIGYEWKEPTFELDESKRPERIESYTLDIDADLSLGTSFKEKLEMAAEMDLGQLKEELAAKKKAASDSTQNSSPSMRKKAIIKPMDYSSIEQAFPSQPELQKMKKKTMFTRLLQRSNVQAVTICGALAYGRCTRETAELFDFDDAALTVFAGFTLALALAVVLMNMAKGDTLSSEPESSNVKM